jgi:hypothetical protein
MKMPITLLAVLLMSAMPVFANNPGQHSILFTFQDASCDASVTCTFNMYQATASGACGAGKTPLVTKIAPVPGNDQYLQGNVAAGTYYTAFTAVDPTTGGESTCSNEVQTSVPGITTKSPSNAAGTVQ